jgi:hypothetical protein
MAQKRFVFHLKDGTIQPILAEFGDEDEEADGYVFFIDSTGTIPVQRDEDVPLGLQRAA